MHITRTDLDDAAARGLLTPQQSAALWDHLTQRAGDDDTPSFKPAHILYYFGGLLAIGAMTLFMTLGWETFRGPGLLAIAAAYAAGGLALTHFFLARKLNLPAGIAAAFAVVMVPLAVYGAQHALGLWPAGRLAYRNYYTHIDWRWVFMELATLAAGAVALWRYRLPFLVMPVAVTLWYMSMDLAPLLLGGQSAQFFSPQGRMVSLVSGLSMLLLALVVEVRSRRGRDFAFWLHLLGVITFWGALTSMDSRSEAGRAVYCGINLLLIVLGAALTRRVHAVFGGLGVAGYLGHLSYSVFRNSMLFPVALTFIGLLVILAGVYWQRNEARLGAGLRALLPAPVREAVERRASA